jgi:hypothetical protein
MNENPVTVSAEPTVGEPVRTGFAPTGSGDWTSACADTTRTSRVIVLTLPALSSASARSVSVDPTCAAFGQKRNWNGKERLALTSSLPAYSRTSLMSPRSSNALTSTSTKSTGLTGSSSAG